MTKKLVEGSKEKVNDWPNHPPRRCGIHKKGKEINVVIHALNCSEAEIKEFLGETEIVG